MYENTTKLEIIKIKNYDILVIYFETFFIPFDIFILHTKYLPYFYVVQYSTYLCKSVLF